MFLLGVLLLLILLILITFFSFIPEWFVKFRLFYNCALMGGLGGVFYCLRAVYINYSVKKIWDKNWEIWYYIRPIVSMISGSVSFIFLKAGLLILESQEAQNSSHYGFLAVAFIAGYNVDKFMKKIENVAESTWGVSKSNVSKESDSK